MMNQDDFNEEDDFLLPKSKSQVKRDMIALQELGERLLTLKPVQLKSLNLPPQLYEAIVEANAITSRGAKRRQLQYIGRLMRDLKDPDAIRHFFDELTMHSQKAAAYHHMLESWRDKLLLDDQIPVTEFIALFPNVDRQRLRQLINNAKKERAFGKPVGATRILFRYIRELHQEKTKNEDSH